MESGTSGKVVLAREGPPGAIDLFAFARISAALAEGARPAAEVLAAEKLTEAEWTEVTLFWARRMAEDAQGDTPRVALVFSDAFAAAQDAHKPTAALSVEAWAALVTDIEHNPGGPAPVLAARGLGMADFARLIRHWARALAADPALARAFDDARTALANVVEGV